MIHFCDTTLATVPANLALDEALLLEAESGGPEVLRVWESSYQAVVIGAGGQWEVEANAVACQRDSVPIVRRSSGGGSVLLGPGCLCFSLILNFDRNPLLSDLHASYRFILNRLCLALEAFVSGITPAGISDLACRELKCSGNAQQRKRHHLLHHGTLLYAFDLESIERYLYTPPRQPDYRHGRSHRDFVMNLKATRQSLVYALRATWHAAQPLGALPAALVQRLMDDKYTREDWHRRR